MASVSRSRYEETLVGETNTGKDGRPGMDLDWSQTGRGFHVDFEDGEEVPLGQGRYLGRGATAEVYETTVQGWSLAHKRIMTRRKISDKEKREIDILKKLSSQNHMIQLVVCDLHTFYEDVEAWSKVQVDGQTPEQRLAALDSVHKERLVALGYGFPSAEYPYKASVMYSKIGCLVSAIAYLHEQKIRHKDLKPSNILLSRERLWLSDFGTATDFSLLSQSATDNERGSLRYFSPEVAAWKPNGRAADIFSLGCILLETIVLHDRGSLDHIRRNSSRDPSFHNNLDRINVWCSTRSTITHRRMYLVQEIKLMLSEDPASRPTAQQLLMRISGYDLASMTATRHSLFGDCCRKSLVSSRQLEEERQASAQQIRSERQAFAKKLEESEKREAEVKLDLVRAKNELDFYQEEMNEHRRILEGVVRGTYSLEVIRNY